MFSSALAVMLAGLIGHQSPSLTPAAMAMEPARWAGTTQAASALKVSRSVSISMVEALMFLMPPWVSGSSHSIMPG